MKEFSCILGGPSRGIELLSEDPQSSILTTVLRRPQLWKFPKPVIIFDFYFNENLPVDLLLTVRKYNYEILVGSHGNFGCTYLCRRKLSYALALKAV